MINNNLLTVFPIYDSIDKQFHRSVGNDVCTFKLITSMYRLLPFQFRRAPSVDLITSIKVVCYNEATETEILPDIPAGQMHYVTTSGWDYITYFGSDDLDEVLDAGDFYLKLSDGTDTWYSEVFHVICDDLDDDSYRITRRNTYREFDDDELRVYI